MKHQYDWHPAIRASFFLLDQGEEKEVLPETRQAFEVATIQISGLVNLVSSRQISFSSTSIIIIIWAPFTRRTSIRPGFENVS